MTAHFLFSDANTDAALCGATRQSHVVRAGALVRTFCLVGALAVAALGPHGVAHAQSAADPAADLGPLTQRWLDDALARNPSSALPLRMEVSVGSLDSRLRLAPCARVEPYLPVGARLWGRTRLVSRLDARLSGSGCLPQQKWC